MLSHIPPTFPQDPVTQFCARGVCGFQFEGLDCCLAINLQLLWFSNHESCSPLTAVICWFNQSSSHKQTGIFELFDIQRPCAVRIFPWYVRRAPVLVVLLVIKVILSLFSLYQFFLFFLMLGFAPSFMALTLCIITWKSCKCLLNYFVVFLH